MKENRIITEETAEKFLQEYGAKKNENNINSILHNILATEIENCVIRAIKIPNELFNVDVDLLKEELKIQTSVSFSFYEISELGLAGFKFLRQQAYQYPSPYYIYTFDIPVCSKKANLKYEV